MAVKIYEGFKFPGKGLTTAMVMSILVDRILKDDDDPVTISGLINETADTRTNVLEALQFLEEKKLIRIIDGSWDECGSLRVEMVTVCVHVDQMTLGLDKPQSENIGIPKPTRDEGGFDEAIRRGVTYFGKVEYDAETARGCQVLTIHTRPSDDKLSDPELQFTGDYATRQRAWECFDNWVSHKSRTTEDFEDTVEITEPSGRKWICEVATVQVLDNDSQKYQLEIIRTEPGEDTSTTVVEQDFESLTEAWAYVDEYLGDPELLMADRDAEQPALEVVEGDSLELDDAVQLEVVSGQNPIKGTEMGIDWRYFLSEGKKPARFEFDLPTGMQTETVFDADTPIEEVAKGFIAKYLDEVPA